MYGIRWVAKKVTVGSHLCEVLRLDPPPEFGRNPTWFSAGSAKRRLREGRKLDYAAEISGVVDRAMERIERQRNARLCVQQFEGTKKDALQKVQFEAAVGMEAAFVRYVRREPGAVEMAVNGYGRPVLRGAKVLQLSAPPESDRNPR